jgi:hypothetical protein
MGRFGPFFLVVLMASLCSLIGRHIALLLKRQGDIDFFPAHRGGPPTTKARFAPGPWPYTVAVNVWFRALFRSSAVSNSPPMGYRSQCRCRQSRALCRILPSMLVGFVRRSRSPLSVNATRDKPVASWRSALGGWSRRKGNRSSVTRWAHCKPNRRASIQRWHHAPALIPSATLGPP